MYCLDEWAEKTITATLFGSQLTRHDDYREVVLDVIPCKEDRLNGVCVGTTSG